MTPQVYFEGKINASYHPYQEIKIRVYDSTQVEHWAIENSYLADMQRYDVPGDYQFTLAFVWSCNSSYATDPDNEFAYNGFAIKMETNDADRVPGMAKLLARLNKTIEKTDYEPQPRDILEALYNLNALELVHDNRISGHVKRDEVWPECVKVWRDDPTYGAKKYSIARAFATEEEEAKRNIGAELATRYDDGESLTDWVKAGRPVKQANYEQPDNASMGARLHNLENPPAQEPVEELAQLDEELATN